MRSGELFGIRRDELRMLRSRAQTASKSTAATAPDLSRAFSDLSYQLAIVDMLLGGLGESPGLTIEAGDKGGQA